MIFTQLAALSTLAGYLTMLAAPLPTYPLACRIRAYVAPGPLTVYNGPGKQYQVLKTLARQSDAQQLSIRAGLGNWMKVTDLQSPKGQLLFAGPGWVYGPALGVSIRPGFIAGDTVKLYADLDTRSKVTAEVKVFTNAVVLNCQGAWVKVRTPGGEGWLHPDHQCGIPGGLCS